MQDEAVKDLVGGKALTSLPTIVTFLAITRTGGTVQQNARRTFCARQ